MVWVFSSISNSSRMQIWSLSWQYGLVLCNPFTKIDRTLTSVLTGYALGGTNLAENQLAPYIQQAKDQVCVCVIRSEKCTQPCHRSISLSVIPQRVHLVSTNYPPHTSKIFPLLISEHNKSCFARIPWTSCAIPFAVRRGWKRRFLRRWNVRCSSE